MNTRNGHSLQSIALTLALALAAPLAGAEEPPAAPPPAAGPGAGPMGGMGHGGMGHGGPGMRCPMHGHKKMGAMIRMPRLPPGNEKLQLQMEAEILQKVGEIQAKYAAKLP